MYEYIDTTDQRSAMDRPAEALQLNGSYIEDILPGYRTLYTKGREAYAPSLETESIGRRAGERIKSRQLKARTITVGYQLITESDQDFRSKYNRLLGILNVEGAELIFADEPDKYFTGYLSEMGDIPTGRNAVTGEFSFTCPDPYKYSVSLYEAKADDTGLITTDYQGTAPSFPAFTVKFPEVREYDADGNKVAVKTQAHNADCGYVALIKDNASILQLGNVDEIASSQIKARNETLLSREFRTAPQWSTAAKADWKFNYGYTQLASATASSVCGSFVLKDDPVATAKKYLREDGSTTDYDNDNNWYGPSMEWAVPTDADGNLPKNFFLQADIVMAAKEFFEFGMLKITLLTSDDNPFIGLTLLVTPGCDKDLMYRFDSFLAHPADSNATAPGAMETMLDGSRYNKSFGIPNPKDAKNPPSNILEISKQDDKVSLKFCGGKYKETLTVRGNSQINARIAAVKVEMCRYAGMNPLTYFGIRSLRFDNTQYRVGNTFTANDVVDIDCGTGAIRKNSVSRIDLGALGNDWETFSLKPGKNSIQTAYSSWTKTGPSFAMQFREVYL